MALRCLAWRGTAIGEENMLMMTIVTVDGAREAQIEIISLRTHSCLFLGVGDATLVERLEAAMEVRLSAS